LAETLRSIWPSSGRTLRGLGSDMLVKSREDGASRAGEPAKKSAAQSQSK
jgi:hypothetical protein